MTKVLLMKNKEIAVTEEKKGKQIAVKENNIATLKKFYQDNFTLNQGIQAPITPENQVEAEKLADNTPISQPNISLNEEVVATPIEPTNIEAETKEQMLEPAVELNPVEVNVPSFDQPQEPVPSNLVEETSTENAGNVGAAPIINLVPENNQVSETAEEMDPELQEIKERLDKVIMDLNNYKKKIKLLEEEVNQNLEKSREVLKDTQAAAKIMSIQQERQRQINEEVTGGSPLENDPTRILQKGA